MKPKHLVARKLLIAAVGVATVNYVVACGKEKVHPTTDADADIPPTSGNLPGPRGYDAGAPRVDVAADDAAAQDASVVVKDGGKQGVKPKRRPDATSGNLVAP